VTALKSGCKFNAGYYVDKVLTPLSEWWRERGCGNFGQLGVHADSARRHNATLSQEFMARNQMARAVQPPYSLDLAPSDFYLFGHVKGLLRGESLETGERLLLAINGILGYLDKWTLTKDFLGWMTRLKRCIEINGDYVG
jgi:hypothetical protein